MRPIQALRFPEQFRQENNDLDGMVLVGFDFHSVLIVYKPQCLQLCMSRNDSYGFTFDNQTLYMLIVYEIIF